MGFFTWTLANKPLKTKDTSFGTEYAESCKLKYGKPGYIICPDNTVICEKEYDGYGIFDGHDAYDLVVDWNRLFLSDIMDMVEKLDIRASDNEKAWHNAMRLIAEAYQKCDGTSVREAIDKVMDIYPEHQYIQTEWKRLVGIEISCKHNAMLPYPLKITDTPCPKKSYAELRPSCSCQ